jgi:hypothetical protein
MRKSAGLVFAVAVVNVRSGVNRYRNAMSGYVRFPLIATVSRARRHVEYHHPS